MKMSIIKNKKNYKIKLMRRQKIVIRLQDELDDIEPDKEPTQEMVDNVVEDRVNDVMRDPISFIRVMGLDIKNFINEKIWQSFFS